MRDFPRTHRVIVLLVCLTAVALAGWQAWPDGSSGATGSRPVVRPLPTISSLPIRPPPLLGRKLTGSLPRHRRPVHYSPPHAVHDTGRVAVVHMLPPHPVGDMFGVGSYVTQRSASVSPLV